MTFYARSRAVQALQWTGDNYREVKALCDQLSLTDSVLTLKGRRVDLWDWIVDGVSMDTATFRFLFSDTQDVDLTFVGTDAICAEMIRRDHNCICIAQIPGQKSRILVKGDSYALLGLLAFASNQIHQRLNMDGGEPTFK